MKSGKARPLLTIFVLIITAVSLMISCNVNGEPAPVGLDEVLAETSSTATATATLTSTADDSFQDETDSADAAEPAESSVPNDSEYPVPAEEPPAADEEDELSDAPEDEAPDAPVISDTPEIPDILAPYYAIAPEGVSYHNLPAGTTQLVVISNTNGAIRANFFESDENNEWFELSELRTQAWGGSNGIRPKQREGDRITPVGQFPVLEAFYIDNEPETGLNTFRVTQDTYWVDDPASVFYNQRVEGTENMDWDSAEHMISYYDSYKYGFVIGYNLNCTPGLGSAVFFHIAQRSTIGCIGVSEKSCLQYLAALDKNKNPYILIVSDKPALAG